MDKQSVFIACRRGAGSSIARAMLTELRERQIDAFLDVEAMDAGKFGPTILNQIEARPYFVLIATVGTFNHSDWLVREIQHAVETQRKLVLFASPDFDADDYYSLPEPLKSQLPGFPMIRASQDSFESALEQLIAFFHDPATLAVSNTPKTGEKKEAKDEPARTSDEIFVSYSRTDWQQYVNPLIDYLRGHDLKVWVDQHLLEGGDDWLDKLGEALERCPCMVLCVSPDALTSKYVKMEYRSFFWDDKQIIPVLCREVAKLPPELRGIQHLSYSDLEALVRRLKNR